jgi:hypothetical protein
VGRHGEGSRRALQRHPQALPRVLESPLDIAQVDPGLPPHLEGDGDVQRISVLTDDGQGALGEVEGLGAVARQPEGAHATCEHQGELPAGGPALEDLGGLLEQLPLARGLAPHPRHA